MAGEFRIATEANRRRGASNEIAPSKLFGCLLPGMDDTLKLTPFSVCH
jgi:hypothetical protein